MAAPAWWPVQPAAPEDSAPDTPTLPAAPSPPQLHSKRSIAWWPTAVAAVTPPAATDDNGPNSTPPMDRPGDADYSPPAATPQQVAPQSTAAAPTQRPHRDMNQFGAGIRDAGGQVQAPTPEPHWWSAAIGVAGNTLGGTANLVAGTLGKGASEAEKSLGGGVRFVGDQLRDAGSYLGPLAPLLQGPGAVLSGVGGEVEDMGGRQAEQAQQKVAGLPGADSFAAHVVGGIPMLTGMAATGGASALIPTAEMGLMGMGSGAQTAEDAGATPNQVAASAYLHGGADAALAQIATVPLIGKLLHGVPAAGTADALFAVAKQGGMGAIQSIGMDGAHHLIRKMASLPDDQLDAAQMAKNAAAQALLQAAFEAPAIEMAHSVAGSPELPSVQPSKPLFHGARELVNLRSDYVPPESRQGAVGGGAYGQGLYTTESQSVARGYGDVVHEVSPPKEAHLLDLDAPISPEVWRQIRTVRQSMQPEDVIGPRAIAAEAEHAATLKRLADKFSDPSLIPPPESPGDPAGDILDPLLRPGRATYPRLRDFYDALNNSRDQGEHQVWNVTNSINQQLHGLGYDGLTHLGGDRTGTDPHQVSIFWDPVGKVDLAGVAPPAAEAPPVDRRVDLATRQRVSQMTPEQMQQALLTSTDVPALPNRRAFDESLADDPAQTRASLDLDSMKAINDHFKDHDAGDALLRNFGQVAADSGINAYHLHGDEFAVLGDNPAHVEIQLQQLRDHMEQSGAHMVYDAPDGNQYKIPMSYSYGIGETPAAAEEAMYASKERRLLAGERVPRGELPPGFGKIGEQNEPQQIPLDADLAGNRGQTANSSVANESAVLPRNLDGQDAGGRATLEGFRQKLAAGRPSANDSAENTAPEGAQSRSAEGNASLLGSDNHYQVTGISADELAKADADKTGNYIPKEATIGTIPAVSERDAIDQLQARISAGEFPRDARLAPPLERSAPNEEAVRPGNEVRHQEASYEQIPQQEDQVAVHAVDERRAVDAAKQQEPQGRLVAEAPEGATSLKNAVVTAERVSRGLPEIELAARKGNEAQWTEAKQRISEDPELPQTLAKTIIDKPRPISGLENDILLHDRMRISLDHREAMAAEEKALASGDQGALTEARVRRASAEAQMEVNDRAARVGGREWAHAGLARQKLIAEDYSPVNLIRRYKLASNGEEVPQEIRDQLAKISSQLDTAQAKADEVASTASEREAGRVVDREANRSSRTAKKEVLDKQYEELSKLFAAKANKAHAGLDPELAGIVAKMAKNRVQAGMRGLGAVVDSIFNDVSPHVDGLEKSDVRDAISGEGAARSHPTQDEATAELASIKRQARLIKRIEDLQEGVPAEKSTKREDPPEVAALKEKLVETKKDLSAAEKPSDQQRLTRTQRRLEARIRDAERGLAPPEARKPLPDTAEIASLRQKLKETLDDQGLSKETTPRQMTDEQRLAALKNRLAKRQAELEGQIASGNFSKKARRPPVIDEESMAAQARVKELKIKADRMIRQQEMNNRTFSQKSLDWTTKWARGVKLSGMATIQKLGAAASMRTFIFKPLEQALGAATLSRVPGYSKIVSRAPIEGGFSAGAVAKSWAEFFSKATRADMLAHLKMHEGVLDLKYGKPKIDPNAYIDYFGHIHAAVKTAPKRAAFRYAMEKQALWYQRQGLDISDPDIQVQAAARAYEYANRDIFMQDNVFTDAFRRATNHLQQNGAPRAAAAANILLPIVKVPTNYASEVGEHLTGLPRALYKTVQALRSGVESLPPEEADNIVRLANKGQVGAAMMGLAAAGVATGIIQGGGFYQKGDKRSKSDLQPGDIRIGGFDIPHMVLHYPAMEAFQVAANMARLMMGHGDSVGSSLFHTGMGLAEEVPFFEEPVRLAESALGGPSGVSQGIGEIARGATIPPDVQKMAKILDERGEHTAADFLLKQFGWRRIEPAKRKAESMFESPLTGLKQEEELGLPLARSNVQRR